MVGESLGNRESRRTDREGHRPNEPSEETMPWKGGQGIASYIAATAIVFYLLYLNLEQEETLFVLSYKIFRVIQILIRIEILVKENALLQDPIII